MVLAESLKFKNIENNLLKLFTLLEENENIAKYVYYLDTNDPLSQPTVTEDLTSAGNYLLTIVDTKIPDKETFRVYLNPYRGKLRRTGNGLGEIIFILDIVCPNTKWILTGKGKLRAYRVADEFSKMVDGQTVAGLGCVDIVDFNTFKVNDFYTSLSLAISVNTSTLKEGVK